MSQLQALAQLYQKSVAFFLEEGPLRRECVLWREQPKKPTSVEIEAHFLHLCEQYQNLEVWCGESTQSTLPRFEAQTERFGYEQAETLAFTTRKTMGLGDHPGSALLNVLEEQYFVKIFHLEFEPSGCAASTLSEAFGDGILLNSNNVRWRRNFDLAHELFHLLTWDALPGNQEKPSVPSEQEEKWATCFASHLLMPEESVRLALKPYVHENQLDYDDIFDIARQFDVSVEAMFWRLHFLYDRKEKTKQDIERSKQMLDTCEKRESDTPPVRPARFRALAIKALRAGEMSLGRFAEYMGISRGEANAYLIKDPEGRQDVKVNLA